MSIVRKPGVTSPTTRNPADASSTGKRFASSPSGGGTPVKIYRPDTSPAGGEPVAQTAPVSAAITITPLHAVQVSPLHPQVQNLERYRVRAPSNLPEANAQGLRVFKNRNYVDIAPGEIVLVRETGTAGEYRASLVSESAALGPALFFDSRSRIWTLERPQPLSGQSKVLDIDIDQLIGEVRKDYAQKHRVHTGSDDSFEYSAAQQGTLFARGLQQFSPEQAGIIRAELKAVENIFVDAGHAIGLKYRDAEGVYESFLGTEHLTVAQRFGDAVARGMALSREYQGVWGEEKFLGIDAQTNSAAWMYKRDFHGRVFINRKYMQAGILSLSLGHEMLHTNRVDRFKTIGPNAVDYFYLDNRLSRLLVGDSPAVYDVPERSVSEAIMRGGLTVEYLNAFADDHDAFLFAVSDFLGIGDDLQLQAAVGAFNSNPQLRTHMAVNNADSLICAAKALQALHQRKIEYAWLDSLIED